VISDSFPRERHLVIRRRTGRKFIGEHAVERSIDDVAGLRCGDRPLGPVAQGFGASRDRVVDRTGERQRASVCGPRQSCLRRYGRFVRPPLHVTNDGRPCLDKVQPPAPVPSCIGERRARVGCDDVHREVARGEIAWRRRRVGNAAARRCR